MNLQNLPALNACFNALSTALLVLGFFFIRRGRKLAHRNCMLGALVSSALFLTGYLTYHFKVHAVTRFAEPAWFRPFYLVILLTHTVLAVVVLPLVLGALSLAMKGRFESHRKVARWAWPVWLYVSVTGVLIYLLLYQIFPQKA